LMKMLQDDKVRKRILPPIGLVLLVLGIFAVVPKLIQYSSTPTPGLISEMGMGIISVVLGLYLIFYAYKIGEKVENSALNLARAVRSGSWMIPFAALTMILLVAGISYGVDAASHVVNNDFVLQVILFVSGTIWLWTFAGLTWSAGKFFNLWLSTSKIHYSYLVVTLSVFAIAFILQGALDSTMYFLGYRTFNEVFVFLEILAGFMLALFGGLLNAALRNQGQASTNVPEAEKPIESSN
jgi:putative membrane protein